MLQANYLPWNKGGGPEFWPRSNVKLSLQYTIYHTFNGARTNYDGAGANTRDNNTLYLEARIVFLMLSLDHPPVFYENQIYHGSSLCDSRFR